LKSDERKHSNTSTIKRPNSTYSNDASTSPSPDRRSQRHYGLETPKRLRRRARSSLCTPQAEDFKQWSKEIDDVFPGGWTVDDGRRLLHGQRLPGPEDSVAWLLSEFLSRPHTRDVSRGTYGYISNLSHPTLYRISGMWSIEERDEERIPVLDVRIEDHDKLAQLVVSPYYEVLARVIVYHGWPGIQHRELTKQIDRLLPHLLKSPGE
jgi:hypothetical protein